MKQFNKLLLELYRLAQNAPAAEFQTQVMDKLREVFDFDSAFWATGVVEPGLGVTAHTHHLYRQPPEMMENWLLINQKDELAFEAFRQQGTTLNAALCGPEWQARFSPEVRAHIKCYGMAHCLSTIIAEPVLQLWTGIGLYQSDPKRPFSEEARAFMQDLVPHLSEVWNISRFALVDSAHDSSASTSYGRAICDQKGVLYNANQRLVSLMLAEWPDWTGPRLPPQLAQALAGEDPSRYTGRHVVIVARNTHNMIRLIVREKALIDTLSAREYDVAVLFSKGANFRTIAESLHIAPVTVRNHLRHIYAKLGISNKLELARHMRDD